MAWWDYGGGGMDRDGRDPGERGLSLAESYRRAGWEFDERTRTWRPRRGGAPADEQGQTDVSPPPQPAAGGPSPPTGGGALTPRRPGRVQPSAAWLNRLFPQAAAPRAPRITSRADLPPPPSGAAGRPASAGPSAPRPLNPSAAAGFGREPDWSSLPRPSLGQTASTPRPEAIKESDRRRTRGALEALGRSIGIETGPRAELGGPAENNEWETRALARVDRGFDPGSGQFTGKELADQVYSEEQIRQLANRSAEPLIRALADQEEAYKSAAARSGGGVDPMRLAALRARGGAETAGAMQGALRDATLDATRLNAEQAARAAENRRQNYAQDLAARLGLGEMGLREAGLLTDAGLQRRGQDQTRDVSRFEGEISQRGQDIGARETAANLTTQRGIARARGEQDLADAVANERLGIGRLGLEGELGRRRQGLDEVLGLGRLGLEGRGQEIQRELGLGGLREQRYRTESDLTNSAAERQSRLDIVERQLANEALDRQSRGELERERIALQRELSGLQMEQQRRQFEGTLGLQRDELAQRGQQFGANLAEQRREAEAGRTFARDAQRRGYEQSVLREREARSAAQQQLERLLPLQLLQQFGSDTDPRELLDYIEELRRGLGQGGVTGRPWAA